MICCDLESLVGRKLPFYRAVALEYGEGRAISGLVLCREHQTCYRFVQLDTCPYETARDVAAYGLYQVPMEQYTKLVSLYSKGAKPKWPLWITPGEQQLRVDTLRDINELEETIWAHGRLDAVVAAENILGAVILGTATRDSISQERVRRNGTRWLAEIGL